MRGVEKFYSVAEIALLLSMSTKWVVEKVKAREMGEDVVNLGGPERPDYRVPASAVNAFIDARRVFSEPGIDARSIGELRRKVNRREEVHV